MARRLALVTVVLFAGALAARAEDDIPWPANDDLTRLERRGHEVYRAETCFLCHGPDARATAPELLRPRQDRPADWLLAHLHDPRSLHPDSPMPASPQLFVRPGFAATYEVEGLIEALDSTGDGRVSAVVDATEAWASDAMRVARASELDVAGLRAPPASALQTRSGRELWFDADGRRAYEDRWNPGDAQGDGVLSLRDVRPEPTEEARALVAYVRRLGAGARTRRDFPEGLVGFEVARNLSRPVDAARGRAAFLRACAACHGETGRGDGPAARFLDTPPTDLARGPFKYRRTAAGQPPDDADLLDVIEHGLPGSGMPPAGLPFQAAMDLVGYLRTLRPDGAAPEPPPETRPLALPADPAAYEQLVLRGRAVYVALECSRCHGTEGRGDGPEAIATFSDGRRIRARDFRPRDDDDLPRLRLRGGASLEAVHRRILTGLDPKGMPGVHAAFADPQTDIPLYQPLKDARLLGGTDAQGRTWPGVGVRAVTDGPYAELLDALHPTTPEHPFGDDWALALYVLHLARSPEEVRRGLPAWPRSDLSRLIVPAGAPR